MRIRHIWNPCCAPTRAARLGANAAEREIHGRKWSHACRSYMAMSSVDETGRTGSTADLPIAQASVLARSCVDVYLDAHM